MISIVVCSINEQFLGQLEKNISSTIGIGYELLAWDNRKEGRGICEVYNKMAARARFDLICFIHEDILFETVNWGRKLHAIFENDPQLGAVGLAGAKYKSPALSGWYTGIKELDCSNIIHRTGYLQEKVLLKPGPGNFEEVVCLDGVLICTTKKIWDAIKFDEQNLRGFHFYDLDFSLRVGKTSRLLVSYEIDVVHITKGGDFGTRWVAAAIDFHSRQKKQLPIAVSGLNMNWEKIDKKIILTWLDVLKHQSIDRGLKMQWIRIQQLMRKPAYYYGLFKFLFYKPLGLRVIHKKKRYS